MTEIKEGYKETEIGVIPEAWEVIKLIDLSDKKDRYSFTGGPFGSDLKSCDYTENGVRVIQLQNIGDGKFFDNSKVFTSEEKANQLFSCNIFPNEIILAKMADPVARACKIPFYDPRYIMCSDGIRLKVNSDIYDVDYCLYSINSSYFRKKAIENSTGTTRLRIGLTALKELKLAVPPLIQQQQIAKILCTTDEHIEELNKTIEDYKLLKKGVMEKLLTEGIGHTEFKETEIGRIPKGWEVKKIEDICEILDSQRKPLNSSERNNIKGDIPYYGANGVVDYINDFIFEEDLILLAEDGGNFNEYATRPIAYKISGKSWVNNHAHILKPSINYVFNWIFYSVQHKDITGYVQGGTRSKLNQKDLRKIQIAIPSFDEQKLCSNALHDIDVSVRLFIEEREDFIQLKKALMEQLLTGKIRVNSLLVEA